MRGNTPVAEDEDDEGETCGDKERAKIVHSVVDLYRRLVSVDRESTSDYAENIKAGREEKNGTPCGAYKGGNLDKIEEGMKKTTDSESCVRTAPRVLPTAAPKGAPAAKVANATDLILEGGNAWARIPS